jgi:hypothetical protein
MALYHPCRMRPRADLDLSSDGGAYEGFKAVVSSQSWMCFLFLHLTRR